MKFVLAAITLALVCGTAAAADAPYKVSADGTKVDPVTYGGFKAWRQANCAACHGAEQQGMVGPSLIVALKKLTKEQVEQTILNGRPNTMMPPHKGNPVVVKNLDGLYAYLKGRSDGKIKPGAIHPMQ